MRKAVNKAFANARTVFRKLGDHNASPPLVISGPSNVMGSYGNYDGELRPLDARTSHTSSAGYVAPGPPPSASYKDPNIGAVAPAHLSTQPTFTRIPTNITNIQNERSIGPAISMTKSTKKSTKQSRHERYLGEIGALVGRATRLRLAAERTDGRLRAELIELAGNLEQEAERLRDLYLGHTLAYDVEPKNVPSTSRRRTIGEKSERVPTNVPKPKKRKLAPSPHARKQRGWNWDPVSDQYVLDDVYAGQ